MATIVEHTTELAMKLRLSKQASERLSQRAKTTGQDVASVASGLIEEAVAGLNFDQASVPSEPKAEVTEDSDNENLGSEGEALTYKPIPARRSYTVQAVVVQRRRGIPAPFGDSFLRYPTKAAAGQGVNARARDSAGESERDCSGAVGGTWRWEEATNG